MPALTNEFSHSLSFFPNFWRYILAHQSECEQQNRGEETRRKSKKGGKRGYGRRGAGQPFDLPWLDLLDKGQTLRDNMIS